MTVQLLCTLHPLTCHNYYREDRKIITFLILTFSFYVNDLLLANRQRVQVTFLNVLATITAPRTRARTGEPNGVLGSAQQEQVSMGELVPLSPSKAELMNVLGEKWGNMGDWEGNFSSIDAVMGCTSKESLHLHLVMAWEIYKTNKNSTTSRYWPIMDCYDTYLEMNFSICIL